MDTPDTGTKILVAQYALTALSSGFNCIYFWSYRSPFRGRRVGALVLSFLNLGILVESIYFGLFTVLHEQRWAGFFFVPRYWLGARMLLCAGSLAVSALVLRRLLWKRGQR